MKELVVCNRQRRVRLDLKAFRRIVLAALTEEFGLADFKLGIHLLGPHAMARINRTHLGHAGPTDVITFDYTKDLGRFGGELFLCPAVAMAQAVAYRASWQSELVRYVIHGVLHLRGYDDKAPQARRLMKRQEVRILRRLSARWSLDGLSRGLTGGMQR